MPMKPTPRFTMKLRSGGLATRQHSRGLTLRRLFATWLLLAASGAALAGPWTVLPGSSLGFSASFQGEAFEGRFVRFQPKIDFDPAKPGSGRFDVAIDLASADTRNSERDDMLHGAEFFNSKKQGQAHYLATKFRALGGNRYVADGTLTLKGISKPVPLTFTWTAGAKPVLSGQATLKRLDFGVGKGEWTDTDLLPNEVHIKTRLVLSTPTKHP